LEKVSTTCGSGWVRSHQVVEDIRETVRIYGLKRKFSGATRLRTHPLPQVVLTSSKFNYGL